MKNGKELFMRTVASIVVFTVASIMDRGDEEPWNTVQMS